MSLGLCLDPDHNAGDVCLCPTGCGGFSLLNRLIMANHERSRTYTAGIDSRHPAHISSLGPTFYCIALLPLEGHWLFCCITDLNLKFERPAEDTKVVTQKKKKKKKNGLFMSADSLWILTNISEQNTNACGFVDRECESIWDSLRCFHTGADWTSYVRPLFLLSFPNINSSTMTQPMLHSPALCGSTVWTQHMDWPGQTAKDGQKNVGFFFYSRH